MISLLNKSSATENCIPMNSSSSYRLDQASAIVRTKNGKVFEAGIEHATGTIANPISDQNLEAKFLGNTVSFMGKEKANNAIKSIWSLDKMANIQTLIRLFA